MTSDASTTAAEPALPLPPADADGDRLRLTDRKRQETLVWQQARIHAGYAVQVWGA